MRTFFVLIVLQLAMPLMAGEDNSWMDVLFFLNPEDTVEECTYVEEVFSGGSGPDKTTEWSTKYAERLAQMRIQQKAHAVGGNVVFMLSSYAYEGHSVYYGVAYACPEHVIERYKKYQRENYASLGLCPLQGDSWRREKPLEEVFETPGTRIRRNDCP